ncbi:MAG TPA: helix-hairpin-helix domain-containing protein [Oscillospiraceae bacterium]|nr:helix-hairpin-helix domain-containing protein [Oscillospiraceae bacterium]
MNNDRKKYYVFGICVTVIVLLSLTAFNFFKEPEVAPVISGGENISYTEISETNSSKTEEQICQTAVCETYSESLVDINTAGKELLMSLNGVGDTIADRIIQYRTSGNYFHKTEDIKNVKGIGDSLFEKIKDHIIVYPENLPIKPETKMISEKTVSSVPSLSSKVTSVSTSVTTKPKQTTTVSKTETETETSLEVDFPLDINSCSADELICIDGIGPIMAERIINYRIDNGGFYSVEEIMNVKGIGTLTYHKILPYIYADTSRLPAKSETVKETTTKYTTVKETTSLTTTVSNPINPVNLNKATVSDLMTLPGINQELAKNIISFRDNQITYFSDIYELLYVDGMTKSIFQQIQSYVYV